MRDTGVEIGTDEVAGFQSLDVTIVLADLRGFTAILAAHPPGAVVEMLNRYLIEMSTVVSRNHGTIDKFMGDSIMVLFGAPVAHHDDVRHALTCAVEMQIAMDRLNAFHHERGLPELQMGIGINTGTVLAGRLGSPEYSVYTVIGSEVNLASRVESYSLRGQILVTEATLARTADFVVAGDAMEVLTKGSSTPVRVRELIAIPALGLKVPRNELRRSPRMGVRIPSTYQLVEQKIVRQDARPAVILDIGYHGVLAELDELLPLFSDLKLHLDLSAIGRSATDVYAKVLRSFERDGRYLAGMEFTSGGGDSETQIRQFVQFLIEGNDAW